MRAERRADGSLVVRDDPLLLRAALLALGAAIPLGVWLQSPSDSGKLALGALGAALCLVSASVLERISFEFDAAARTLRWTRRSPWRRRAGQVPFAEIESVDVRVREDREREGAHVRVDRSLRIVLATRSGPLELTHRSFADEAEQTAIAAAMREILGHPPRPVTADTLEDLVAGGDLVAAIRLARATRGLSLVEAEQLVDALREKTETSH